jgi:hypothetical protein
MLVREPRKVKRMTRGGQRVQITDNGDPLWILQAVGGADIDEAARRRGIDEILDESARRNFWKIRVGENLCG